MPRAAIEEARYAAYRRGYSDAQRGVFSPPTERRWLETVMRSVARLTVPFEPRLSVEEKVAAYREGHSAYGQQW